MKPLKIQIVKEAVVMFARITRYLILMLLFVVSFSCENKKPPTGPDDESTEPPIAGASNIYKVAAIGGEIFHVVSDSLSVTGIEWSPDGNRLVYFQYNSDSKELKCWSVVASGGEPALSEMEFEFVHPSPGVYSLDGSQLAAWKDHEIWVVPAEEF